MLITNREELKKYATDRRLWQGIPSIEVTAGGRIYLTFYSGNTVEGRGNFCMLIRSDDGMQFSEPIAVVFVEGDARCYDPCLWIDPMGRLWFWWAQSPNNAVHAVICDDPDAEALSWCEEFVIGSDVMMNKPTVLTTGEWLFPLAVWSEANRIRHWDHGTDVGERLAFAYRTSDNGATFERLGGADVPKRAFDEHMILELRDGMLAMFVRTTYGIGVSYSYDRGLHWSEGRDSGIPGPCSRFHIRRLQSGKILLVNHYEFTGRNNLYAMLSDDEGKTWNRKLLLDARSDVSYPDVTVRDGFIYITYDRERGGFKNSLQDAYSSAREILVAKVTEEDIIAGKLVNPESYLARVASKLGKYYDEESNPYREIKGLPSATVARTLVATCPQETLLQKIFDAYPTNCVNMHKIDSEALDALIEELENGGDIEDTVVRIIDLLRSVNGETCELSPIITAVCDYAKAHVSEEITVGEIAGSIGISRYYLAHLFKRETGTTVSDYIGELRISGAKRMLIETEMGIGEIAHACGFSDASYFTKRFSASVGMTPKEYRRLHA
ncbi:MAG: helix-turn-helix domain-containing protein [Clostridia bacterium]|nr:helix-turn-helix domain-containing protein [Clostridia bacterium]